MLRAASQAAVFLVRQPRDFRSGDLAGWRWGTALRPPAANRPALRKSGTAVRNCETVDDGGTDPVVTAPAAAFVGPNTVPLQYCLLHPESTLTITHSPIVKVRLLAFPDARLMTGIRIVEPTGGAAPTNAYARPRHSHSKTIAIPATLFRRPTQSGFRAGISTSGPELPCEGEPSTALSRRVARTGDSKAPLRNERDQSSTVVQS